MSSFYRWGNGRSGNNLPKSTQLVRDMLGCRQGSRIRGQLGLEGGDGASQSLLFSLP